MTWQTNGSAQRDKILTDPRFVSQGLDSTELHGVEKTDFTLTALGVTSICDIYLFGSFRIKLDMSSASSQTASKLRRRTETNTKN